MERFANDVATTLNGTITSGATSLVVTSATGFPAANFRIRIDDEYLLVTAVAGTTWTVTRAQEGSVAVAHTNGAAVTHVLTAGGLAQALTEVTQSDIVLGSTSSPTTAAGTYATIPQMTKALTTSGGNVLVIFSGTFNANAVCSYAVGLRIDAAAPVTASVRTVTEVTNGYYQNVATAHLFTGLAAGTYTFEAQWVSDAVNTVTAVGTQRSLIAVEL